MEAFTIRGENHGQSMPKFPIEAQKIGREKLQIERTVGQVGQPRLAKAASASSPAAQSSGGGPRITQRNAKVSSHLEHGDGSGIPIYQVQNKLVDLKTKSVSSPVSIQDQK